MNCVAPGPFRTEGFERTYDVDMTSGMQTLPIPRFGRVHEAAQAVVCLASPAASYITGEVLYVAGGQQLYGNNQALLDDSFDRPFLDGPSLGAQVPMRRGRKTGPAGEWSSLRSTSPAICHTSSPDGSHKT